MVLIITCLVSTVGEGGHVVSWRTAQYLFSEDAASPDTLRSETHSSSPGPDWVDKMAAPGFFAPLPSITLGFKQVIDWASPVSIKKKKQPTCFMGRSDKENTIQQWFGISILING